MSAPAPRRLPLLTLTLVCVSLALLAAPEVAAHLRFERVLLTTEPWRLVLGHLVHERSIAAVDLSVLAVLGAWWELRSRATCVWILLVSALLASLALLVCTSFASYTGSSALGSGLFVPAALALVLEERGAWRLGGVLALLLFAAKCALEAAGVEALFAALPAGTRVAAVAHVAGGVGGTLVVLARKRREPRTRASCCPGAPR